jgi:hypothetical protein
MSDSAAGTAPSKKHPLTRQAMFGGKKETSYHYIIKTDQGAETTPPTSCPADTSAGSLEARRSPRTLEVANRFREDAPTPCSRTSGPGGSCHRASQLDTETGKNRIGQTLYKDQRGSGPTSRTASGTANPWRSEWTRQDMQFGVNRADDPDYQLAERHPT